MWKVVFGTVLALLSNALAEKVVWCYYGTWATYRYGNGKCDVGDLDPFLCTHLVYTFVGLDEDGTVKILDPYLDLAENWGRDNFGKFNALKKINPKLKTILAIGGWNEGSYKYSVMANSPQLRARFANDSAEFVVRYGFDGFDLDWEYPARRDSSNGAADVDAFTNLVSDLRQAFDRKKPGLLLSAAVSSVEPMAALSYNIPEISKYLDYIGLMTYDFYGSWDPVTGHNAALHKGEGDDNVPREDLYTADVAVEYWLRKGAPPAKLLLGMPLYGRSFNLADPSNSGLRAPTSGAGIAGAYTAQAGVIGYNEFCERKKNEQWNIHYDFKAEVPYAVRGRDWVSYDDKESLVIKSKYALEQNLAGIMIWSIETDDFKGVCSGKKFPLLTAINEALGRVIDINPGTTTTSKPITSETTTTLSSTSTTISSTSTTTAPVTTPETTTTTPVITTTTGSSTTMNVRPTTTATPITTTTGFSTTTTGTTKTTISHSTTTGYPPTNPSGPCFREGYARDPIICSVFYFCVKGLSNELIPFRFDCPKGLLWDNEDIVCNYSHLVDCSS